LEKDEFYVRDVSGKEIATYEGTTLQQWNVYGLDNVGYIKNDTRKYFYLKDHLGSVRVVIDEGNQIVSANDYDAWGFELRSYQSENAKYKFTGKERDNESSYDYFGVRYYDGRIGRWGGVEPLMEKYISYSPYQYSLLNPLRNADLDGRDAIVKISGNNIEISFVMRYTLDGSSVGLSDNQYKVLENFKSNIESEWSGTFKLNNKEYNIVTKVELKEESTLSELGSTEDGSNRVLSVDNTTSNLGVEATSSSINLRKSNLIPKEDSGAHEAGHLLGLKDLENSNKKMGYNSPREKPGSEEFKEIFQKANINLKKIKEGNFIIRGIEGNEK